MYASIGLLKFERVRWRKWRKKAVERTLRRKVDWDAVS